MKRSPSEVINNEMEKRLKIVHETVYGFNNEIFKSRITYGSNLV